MSFSESARSRGMVIEISNATRVASAGLEPASRADMLAYVEEMCVTLSYLTAHHDCQQLSGILTAAARAAAAARGSAGGTAL